MEKKSPLNFFAFRKAVLAIFLWAGVHRGWAAVSPQIITNAFIPATRHSEYVTRAWTRDDGLPQNAVHAIAQTPDKYLWLGTENGLARFDGVRFVVFDPANTPVLKSSRIAGLFVDRTGRLWILSEFGDTASYANGLFKNYGQAEGVPTHGFKSLAEDGNGTLWAGTRYHEGSFSFENGRFVESRKAGGFVVGTIHTMAREADGTVWGLQPIRVEESERLVRVGPGQQRLVDVSDNGRVVQAQWLGASRDGGTWVVTRRGLHLYRKGVCEKIYELPAPILAKVLIFDDRRGNATSVLEDSRGNVWVGTKEEGLLQFDLKGSVRQFFFGDTEEARDIRALFEDAEGNLWVGLAGAGLRLMRPTVFTTFDRRDGLGGDEVRTVCEDSFGNILSVNRMQVTRIHDQVAETLIGSGVFPTMPHAILPDRDGGALWIATWGSGLYRWENGKTNQYLAPFMMRYYGPRSSGLLWRKNGELIMSARDGVYRIDGEHLKPMGKFTDLRTVDVRAMAEDSHGNLYLGLNADGLIAQSGETWRRFSLTNGLPGNDVWSLHMDRDDALWAGALGAGLFRFKDGVIATFNDPGLGLPRVVSAIIEDDDGFLWLGSNDGIFRVERRALNQWSAGKNSIPEIKRFGLYDGLTTTECTAGFQPAVCKARDGKIWFATTKGVSMVDPKRLPHNRLRPPVWIEEVRVDDRPVALDRNGSATVPAGNHRVEIKYTAPSFTGPEKVMFRYKLENYDADWIPAGTRRTAYFQGLRPGNYNFRAIACNDDGAWSVQGAQLAFAVQPFYWQTTPFRMGVIALAGALLIAAYRRRIHDLEGRRMAQQDFARRLIESQETERKRMAAELHDGLGQKLQLIRNRAQLALHRGEAGDGTALRDISATTGEAIGEIRAITYALRPAELDQVGLTGALNWMVESVATASGLRVLKDIDDLAGFFTPEEEMNLYRIVQEAFNNIVRHAHATEVTVELKKEADRLAVTIFDNGRGFDVAAPAPARGGGLGLASMAERVLILRGTIEFHSVPGKGTRLQIMIPAKSK